jgi:AAA domain
MDLAVPPTRVGVMKDRLLGWIGALDEEIEFLTKESAEQAIALTSGTRDPSAAGPGGLYVFLMADALRIPEDAAGTLRSVELEVPAMVVAHEGNRLSLLLEARNELPEYIASARFEVSETQLLEGLKDCMKELVENGDVGLCPRVFGLEAGHWGAQELPTLVSNRLGSADMMRHSLEQALGSDVTFLWGPPGTGKTLSIAALVATLVHADETVVVTSHTHAAVEQALWALVEPPAPGRVAGLLHDDDAVSDGRILKIGPLRQSKIPVECHLDGRLELERQSRRDEIAELRARLTASERELARRGQQLEAWRRVAAVEPAVESARSRHDRSLSDLQSSEIAHGEAQTAVADARSLVASAERSFIVGRKRRIATAVQELQRAHSRVGETELALLAARRHVDEDDVLLGRAKGPLEAAKAETRDVPSYEALQHELAALETSQHDFEDRLAALQHVEDDHANHLLDIAAGVFVTLTKLYMDPRLHKRRWDTVIIDEASMAMPPLVAWASCRARKRVIICGDFYQLPPIVRSREGSAPAELGRDVFALRDIPEAIEHGHKPEHLARLVVQHRMHPLIADIARTLCMAPTISWTLRTFTPVTVRHGATPS